MSRAGHLTRRFFGSLWPVGPGADDERFVVEHLTGPELRLWAEMSRADRRHSVQVARDTVELLDGQAPRPVVAAALLHDVGKTASGLGTYGRVIATLSAAVAGRDTAEAWSGSRGFTRRVGLYLRHPELGAEMLELAGSDPLTVAWTAEHHLPSDRWTVDERWATALDRSDND